MPRATDVWQFTLRGGDFSDCSSDNDDPPSGSRTLPSFYHPSEPSEARKLADLDLANREDAAVYKPNPWSIARINAATRAPAVPAVVKPQPQPPHCAARVSNEARSEKLGSSTKGGAQGALSQLRGNEKKDTSRAGSKTKLTVLQALHRQAQEQDQHQAQSRRKTQAQSVARKEGAKGTTAQTQLDLSVQKRRPVSGKGSAHIPSSERATSSNPSANAPISTSSVKSSSRPKPSIPLIPAGQTTRIHPLRPSASPPRRPTLPEPLSRPRPGPVFPNLPESVIPTLPPSVVDQTPISALPALHGQLSAHATSHSHPQPRETRSSAQPQPYPPAPADLHAHAHSTVHRPPDSHPPPHLHPQTPSDLDYRVLPPDLFHITKPSTLGRPFVPSSVNHPVNQFRPSHLQPRTLRTPGQPSGQNTAAFNHHIWAEDHTDIGPSPIQNPAEASRTWSAYLPGPVQRHAQAQSSPVRASHPSWRADAQTPTQAHAHSQFPRQLPYLRAYAHSSPPQVVARPSNPHGPGVRDGGGNGGKEAMPAWLAAALSAAPQRPMLEAHPTLDAVVDVDRPDVMLTKDVRLHRDEYGACDDYDEPIQQHNLDADHEVRAYDGTLRHPPVHVHHNPYTLTAIPPSSPPSPPKRKIALPPPIPPSPSSSLSINSSSRKRQRSTAPRGKGAHAAWSDDDDGEQWSTLPSKKRKTATTAGGRGGERTGVKSSGRFVIPLTYKAVTGAPSGRSAAGKDDGQEKEQGKRRVVTYLPPPRMAPPPPRAPPSLSRHRASPLPCPSPPQRHPLSPAPGSGMKTKQIAAVASTSRPAAPVAFPAASVPDALESGPSPDADEDLEARSSTPHSALDLGFGLADDGSSPPTSPSPALRQPRPTTPKLAFSLDKARAAYPAARRAIAQ